MDIDLLAKMVKEVVMDHDVVTLPGVGSFVAELVPATFADRGYTILPPYRRLYFSPKQGEDTLLADLYANSNGISQADATRILTDFLAEMKDVLKVKKTIVFPGLGRLRATMENHFFFVADEDLDIYPSGFGLQPISLKTHEETKEEVAEAVASLAGLLEKEPEEIPGQAGNDEVVPEPVKEPELESEEIPDQVGNDEANPEPVAEPEPVVEPEPVAEPEPEPAVVIPSEASESPKEDTLGPADLGMTEKEPEPEPEEIPDQVGNDEAEPEPVAEPQPEEIPDQVGNEEAPRKKKGSGWHTFWTVILVLVIVALVLAIALVAVGNFFPEWLDSFLYSPEEYDILHN